MSNQHTNHQHGLHSMNATRPKSKMHKRKNKAGARERKAPLLEAMHKAVIEAKEKTPSIVVK